MTNLVSCLYAGSLLHRRYRPRRHELRYDVMNLFVDVDELPQISRKSWLFGYNRFKLFSIQDRHHGPGDGTPVAQHVRDVMGQLELRKPASRIFMFCYPAVLGRVFNPLTVYYGFDDSGHVVCMVYEVNNTFGQRHTYALAVDGFDQHISAKQFCVSPFNPVEGEYRFGGVLEDKELRLNIALFEHNALKLCARFEGHRVALSDRQLLCSLLPMLVQPIKVVAGIHWEALKLYLKGLRPLPRPPHARFSITHSKAQP
jgi:DUF1365 family protein